MSREKYTAYFFVLAMLAVSCSGFSHMHYRKMRKVPAAGISSSPVKQDVRAVPVSSFLIPEGKKTKTPMTVSEVLPRKKNLPSAFPQKHFREKTSHPVKTVQQKIPVHVLKAGTVKRRGGGEGMGLLIALLLLWLGIVLLSLGILLVWFAIAAIAWLALIGGILLVVAGLLLAYGSVLTIFTGDHYHPDPYSQKPKSKKG
ncbi:MAG TPA: hypothetical protein VFU15_08195 [Bacteroidia bacterium]|nr:hypothetical protein [Bacteroidia bacterium]